MTAQNLDDAENEISLDFVQTRRSIDTLIKSIPKGIFGEDYRAACSVITGTLNGKTLSECAKYYSLDLETAQKWWKHFNFNEYSGSESRKKRGAKTASLEAFIKTNIGKTFKSSEILDECEITNPTLYNFINSNRGYFKKVGRGMYEIVDMNSERIKDKNAKASKL